MKNTIIAVMVLGILLAGCSAVTENKALPSEKVSGPLPAESQGEEIPRMCTMEYMPVCGIDGVTYGNKCQAGSVPIAHSGECAPGAAAKMPALDAGKCAGGQCPKEPVALEPVEPEPLLGGDRDEHGCIGSAGYSWCGLKQKCIRPWEEKC